MAGRDCWHAKCTFCSWTTLYPRYRTGSPQNVVDEIEQLVGKKAVIEHQPVVKADMLANLADISKAQRILNWNPEVELDEGLRRTVNWYLQGRDWLKDIRI